MSADLLTEKEKAILAPWASLYARLDERLDRMSDDELGALYGALNAPTSTNCWYAFYRAAEVLRPIVSGKCGERTMQKMKAMDADEPKSNN